jgi:TetR/AcrR family transcriptional repressor of bet genes
MNSAAAVTAAKKRTEPKEKRQVQLIQATIRSIAKHGLSDTTIATVAREAGLSQGIINLHFQSKERLLLETLSYVVDEYKTRWEKAFARAGEASADRLFALVEVDFHPSLCDRNKLALWFAFWSETKSRPTYRKLCAERDRGYDQMMRKLCADVVSEGGYDVDPEIAARGLAAMTEGLWLDMLLSPRSMTRQQALEVSLSYLRSLFPAHFGQTRFAARREK